jgi:uncharacterized membrane protein YfcA
MNAETLIKLVLIGLVTGASAGLLGIGGGLILIPSLIYFMGFDQHQAIGLSLAVMLPPIGLFAAYNYYKTGHINLWYALIIAAAFMIGSYLTSKVAVSLPDNTIRKIFSVVLFLIAIRMFFSK